MGVTCVTQWPVAEGKSMQQTVDFLTKKAEFMGATKTGTFAVDCDTFHASAGNPKFINVLHNSEYPKTTFSITDSNSTLVSDTGFDAILQKLKGIYSTKMSSRIESKGKRYQLADFIVKVGIVSIGSSNRGILVEVEYTPCVILQDCWPLLTEFMQGFLGNGFVPKPPSNLVNKVDVYQPLDTINQYLEHFNQFRKAQVPTR
ncbi:Mediator of RNA polymerase II transcription subunit 20 [Holothuria leucospilota]|uniref:Mediator of RNA polymerase II transcription subunit 20 n=1 Tax=Holothuria leucospilota TaxID=206669 RepID=A0A9Q1CKY6_HOLLE|nr:Mediator of RNA polymerase II transcription subunit 20 [Holothuria leucospilota]